jgi:hypothetical protein
MVIYFRFDKRRDIHRRKDFSDDRVNNHSHQTFNRPRAADQWHDPWQRSVLLLTGQRVRQILLKFEENSILKFNISNF